MLGALQLSIVNQYRYLGLIYDSAWRFDQQFTSMLTKAARVSHLITRIITPAVPLRVTAIRTLVLGMLMPTITYGSPFLPLTAPHQHRINALLCRPLARALLLPPTVHHLSLLIECAVSNIATEWELETLRFAARCRAQQRGHPSRTLIDTRPPPLSARPLSLSFSFSSSSSSSSVTTKSPASWPRYCMVRTVDRLITEWSLPSLALITTLDLINHSYLRRIQRWIAAARCLDYIALRTITAPSLHPHLPVHLDLSLATRICSAPPRFMRYDERATASLRSRLRLNRSTLQHSMFCRHMDRSTSACSSCHAPIEDPAHLLVCPLYEDARFHVRILPGADTGTGLLTPDYDPVRFPHSLHHLLGEFTMEQWTHSHVTHRPSNSFRARQPHRLHPHLPPRLPHAPSRPRPRNRHRLRDRTYPPPSRKHFQLLTDRSLATSGWYLRFISRNRFNKL